jgi:hypothetical protein
VVEQPCCGKHYPLTKGRIDINAVAASFFVALTEVAKISQKLPANHPDANAELSMKMLVLQHMHQEILGEGGLSVQTFNHSLDDIAPANEGNVESLQEKIDNFLIDK